MMNVKNVLKIFIALAIVSCGGDESSDAEGTAGGPCYANETCNAGLTCEGGVCVAGAATGTCSGNFPHSHKGLCWSEASPNLVLYSNAISYCDGLGGRLPKIQELRMLIKECPQTEFPRPSGQSGWCAIEDPGKLNSETDHTSACNACVADASGKYSLFSDRGYFWSFSSLSDYNLHAWYIDFNNGYVNGQNKLNSANARCVK